MKLLPAVTLAGLLALTFGNETGGAAAERRPAERVGDRRSCLTHSQLSSSVAEDGQTIRFELLGGRIYRNRLSAPCPGLAQAVHGFGALAFDLHGGQLCRGDLVRVVDPARAGTMTLRTAPACPLGPFERVADRPARPRR